MHMADVEKNFWGGHAIVGAHLPIASGLALEIKCKATGSNDLYVRRWRFNIGYFHEAVNLSKVWDLPVLWVVENNHYGMERRLNALLLYLKYARKPKAMAYQIVRSMG